MKTSDKNKITLAAPPHRWTELLLFSTGFLSWMALPPEIMLAGLLLLRAASREMRMAERRRVDLSDLVTRAQIGSQTQAVLHELKNSLFVFSLCEHTDTTFTRQVLLKTCDHMRRIFALVLPDGRDGHTGRTHRVAVGGLIADIELVLANVIKHEEIQWQKPLLDDDLNNASFQETEGAAYLILQGLILNARTSVGGARRAGSVGLRVYQASKGWIGFCVVDNGRSFDGGSGQSENEEKGKGFELLLSEQLALANGFKLEWRRDRFHNYAILLVPSMPD